MIKLLIILCSVLALCTSINVLATDLKVGDIAPDFNLQATTGDFL